MRASSLMLGLTAMAAVTAADAMSLAEALQRAVDRDPTIPLSLARRDAEATLGAQERAALRPSLSLRGTGDYNRSDSQFAFGSAKDKYPSWSAYLEARQALLRLDWSARGDRADARDAIAEDRQDERVRQFVVRVATRYLDTLLAEDTHDQAQSELRAVRESLSDTRKRYEAELVPGTDLKEAMARDDLAQAQLVSAAASLENARDALEEVTGYDRAPLPTLREELTFPPLDPPDLASWEKFASEHSGALAEARNLLDVARADVSTRKAEALPTADLVGTVGRNDSSEYVLGQRQDDARIGVELNIPIYAGGLNRARVREAEARLREAEADFKRIELETLRTVRTQFRDVETARAEEQAYRRALESAIVAEAAARAGYDAGTRTITDVLDAKSRVVQARARRNAAGYALVIRLLSLNATAGRLTADLLVSATDPLFVPRAESADRKIP